MDEIKEEIIKEFKLEKSCDDSIDVDDNNDFKLSLPDQKVKLKKKVYCISFVILNDFMVVLSWCGIKYSLIFINGLILKALREFLGPVVWTSFKICK